MTISKLLLKGVRQLQHASQTPQLDSEVLLSFVLKKSKAYLYSHPDKEVSASKEKKFLQLIIRRAKSEPIAYLTNQKEFYDLTFYVDQSVLIPRPETEQLVDLVIKEIEYRVIGMFGSGWNTGSTTGYERNQQPIADSHELKIIDIGTGCGNIGISLIYEIIKKKLNRRVKFIFYLTDISGKALKVAKKNFKRLIQKHRNIKVQFMKADLFDDFKNKFDIVVSNPPYIPEAEIELLDPGVRKHEPHIALNGGEKGISTVKRLIKESLPRLESRGVLLFEMHEKHPNEIRYFLEENYPKYKASFKKDCFGMWRFAIIRKE